MRFPKSSRAFLNMDAFQSTGDLLTNLSLDAGRRSNYCDAMRYFFHIVGALELFPDELGRCLLTLESGKRHAKVLADELKKGGDFCGSCLVRVVDEGGNTLFELPGFMSGGQSARVCGASRPILWGASACEAP
jgi:hypothetical protein